MSADNKQEAEKVRQRKKTVIWFVRSVLFVWLNETNQINKTNQINQMNQTDRYLARIIHEHFCCNRRSAATTSLRPAGSPLGPSPYCTSTHQALTAPRAGLATRLSDFATTVMNNAG